MHLIVKRILALIIDWAVILLYAGTLFAMMAGLAAAGFITLGAVHPVTGQIIGFCTLTLPVILYSILMESGQRHATLGKRVMKIEVTGDALTRYRIMIRNILKFFPGRLRMPVFYGSTT